MPLISAQEWIDFEACRRRWEYSSPQRRNLEPAARHRGCDLERAITDALAVYYFPGMWDWPRAVVLPLVIKGFERAISGQKVAVEAEKPLSREEGDQWSQADDAGRRILDSYLAQAPVLDHFAPVLVETEFAAPVPDPRADPDQGDRGLVTADREGVTFTGRVDVLVVDEFDAYWIVRHRLVQEWTATETLVADPQAGAACWAWARFYLGMSITGTIDNELSLVAPPSTAQAPGRPLATHVAQSEGSGGGRSVPQHRRLSARALEPAAAPKVEVEEAPGMRRVWIRRSPADTEAAAARLAADLAQMIDPTTPTPPHPSRPVCARCAFLRPCLETMRGRPEDDALASGYRGKPLPAATAGRLGSVTWSTGRGAAPPPFRPTERPES